MSSLTSFRRIPVRSFSAEPEESPATTDQLDPEVQRVIDDILKLNLIQVNQMVTHLKDKFGFVESAPVAMAAAPAAAQAADAEEEKRKKRLS